MASFNSAAAFRTEVVKLGKELSTTEAKRITREMAEKAQRITQQAAAADLGGDAKFSGWRPRLDTQIKPTRDYGHVLMPTRSSAGPWTVAERGRNQGNASGFSGPGINVRTGRTARTKSGAVRKVRARQARRWNGRTIGKRTASDAIRQMERWLPRIAEDGLDRVIRKHFD